MIRWLRFLLFVIYSRLRLKAVISLAARVKFPRYLVTGRECRIQSGCIIDAPGPHKVIIGPNVNINRGAYIGGFASIRIGDRTSINRGASIDARMAITIGRDVLIGPFAQVVGYQHVFLLREKPINTQGITGAPITIEDDVWIGAGAIVLSGVIIGKGSVVGAGAVVTRSCPPYSIIVGVPARIIGVRGEAVN